MQLELVTDGLEFPEGPIALADGSVVLVEIHRQTLTRVRPDGTQEVIARLGGGPNGAAIGPDGAVYVTNNGGFGWLRGEGGTLAPHGTAADYVTGSIQRVDLKTGKVTTLYEECAGIRLRGPNDLVFDRSGGFWFSDLGKGNGDVMHMGHVLYARPDGSKIVRARDAMLTPNGVGLAPATDLFSAAKVLGPLPGYQLLDSLAVEAGGKVCVATLVNGGITAFDPNGGVEHTPVPDPLTTNLCFGGADLRTAFITASSTGKLYRCRWPRPGLKLAFNA
jgi:gluconolactonase